MAHGYSCGCWLLHPDIVCPEHEQVIALRSIDENVKDAMKLMNLCMQREIPSYDFILQTIDSKLEGMSSLLEWGMGTLHSDFSHMSQILSRIAYNTGHPNEIAAKEALRDAELYKRQWADDRFCNHQLSNEQHQLLIDKAYAQYEKVIDHFDFHRYEVYLSYAEYNIMIGYFDWALELLDKAATFPPMSTSGDFAFANSQRVKGRVLFTLDRFGEAKAALAESVNRLPGYDKARYDYVLYSHLSGDEDEACKHLEIVIKRNPVFYGLAQREVNFHG